MNRQSLPVSILSLLIANSLCFILFFFQLYHRLQRERAEKERLAHQRRAEYLQNLQYHPA